MTARDTILLALADCSLDKEVRVADIVVAAWRRDPVKFGLPGFQHTYPDSNKVYVEIMNKKPQSVIGLGLVVKTRPSHYGLTPLGRHQVARLKGEKVVLTSHYDIIGDLAARPAYLAWVNDPGKPDRRPEAEAFGSLSVAEAQVRAAMADCDRRNAAALTAPGCPPIRFDVMANLLDFIRVLRGRFPRLAEAS